MTEPREWSLTGFDGTRRHAVTWSEGTPRYVALLSHGYGEHVGRYQHVADALVRAGAAVYGIDHIGHGRSGGERVVVPDYEGVVEDLHRLDQRATEENPGLPVVLVGHSMGGLIAMRYAQEHADTLEALVLSGPQLAGKQVLAQLLALPAIPEFPIDPTYLSRDPAIADSYANDPLVWQGGMQRPTVEAMVRALEAVEDGKRIESLPVLWMHGSADLVSPLDGVRPLVEAVVTGSLEQRAYEGARHEIFNETNRDEVIADLVAFVDRVVAG